MFWFGLLPNADLISATRPRHIPWFVAHGHFVEHHLKFDRFSRVVEGAAEVEIASPGPSLPRRPPPRSSCGAPTTPNYVWLPGHMPTWARPPWSLRQTVDLAAAARRRGDGRRRPMIPFARSRKYSSGSGGRQHTKPAKSLAALHANCHMLVDSTLEQRKPNMPKKFCTPLLQLVV